MVAVEGVEVVVAEGVVRGLWEGGGGGGEVGGGGSRRDDGRVG